MILAELVEKRSVERVPDEERTTGVWPLFMLWAGFTIAIGRLWVGGVIAEAGFYTAVLAYIIAHALMIFVPIGGIMGASEGLPGTMIMRAAFGIRGRVLPSVPMIIGTIGWFGLQLGMTASALDIIIGNLYGGWGVPMKVQYVVWAFLMGIISVYGYKVVMWFQKFVSPLLILLIPWMLYRMFTQYDVLHELGRPREATMSIFQAITISTGGGLAMMIGAADSSRYAKSRSTAFLGYMTANWSVGIVITIVGMMGAVIVGVWDPASIVDRLGLGFLGLLIVVFSAWSTNCLNPYWGGIALSTLASGSSLFKNGISRATSTAIIVGIGAVTALMGIYSITGLMTFVSLLAATLGPANGIAISDYFFIRGKGTNKLDTGALSEVGGKYWYIKGWNPIALAVWLLVGAYAIGFRTTYVLITPVSSQIIAGVMYYALMKTVGRKYLEG